MKKIFITGFALAFLLGGGVWAQDDVYYNGNQAEQQAQQEAQQNQNYNQQQSQTNSAPYYNSSQGSANYDQNSYDSDAYVDYDDGDSYASRIQRFNYPVAGMGYWGGIYNPFWGYPYYGGFYPGLSFSYGYPGGFGWGLGISFGFGWGSLYSGWGWPYYGGGFGWPYYGGYGWGGYGRGYWNGYYAGLHEGGYGYGRGYYYGGARGERTSRGVSNVGNYGRTAPVNRNMVEGRGTLNNSRGTKPVVAPSNQRISVQPNQTRQSISNERVVESRPIQLNGNTRVYNNNLPSASRGESFEVSPNGRQSFTPAQSQNRAQLNSSNSNVRSINPTPNRSMNRSESNVRPRVESNRENSNFQPSRSFTPSRSYTPSRSFTPSRSSSSGSRSFRGRR